MTKIRTGQITPSSEAWSTWTPTWSNLTVGNGTQVARYSQIGKTVNWMLSLTFGSTSSMGTLPTFTLPVAANSNFIPAAWFRPIGTAVYAVNGSTGLADGYVFMNTLGACTPIVLNTSTTYATDNALSSTVPGTWTTGYIMHLSFSYEAA